MIDCTRHTTQDARQMETQAPRGEERVSGSRIQASGLLGHPRAGLVGGPPTRFWDLGLDPGVPTRWLRGLEPAVEGRGSRVEAQWMPAMLFDRLVAPSHTATAMKPEAQTQAQTATEIATEIAQRSTLLNSNRAPPSPPPPARARAHADLAARGSELRAVLQYCNL
eukprot:1726939-Rhodomonas_salina.3